MSFIIPKFKPTTLAGQSFIAPSSDQSHRLTLALADQINLSIAEGLTPKPDLVIAFGRGAWTHLKTFADWLNVDNVATLRLLHYQKLNQAKTKPVILQGLPLDINGLTILAFDDVTETGKTFLTALDYLSLRGAKKVITASLFKKPQSKFDPDFFATTTKSWIIFSSDYKESIKYLTSQWLDQGVSLKVIYNRFQKIGLNQNQLDLAMSTLFNYHQKN